jgi:hypothetical protein
MVFFSNRLLDGCDPSRIALIEQPPFCKSLNFRFAVMAISGRFGYGGVCRYADCVLCHPEKQAFSPVRSSPGCIEIARVSVESSDLL